MEKRSPLSRPKLKVENTDLLGSVLLGHIFKRDGNIIFFSAAKQVVDKSSNGNVLYR